MESSPGTANDSVDEDLTIENLRTLARLYGYVKYFHPSDEAAAVDWNRFAVLGAARVLEKHHVAGLQSILSDLFAPIAPTLEIYKVGEPPDDERDLIPSDPSTYYLVAWQHLGDGIDVLPDWTSQSTYASCRTNRPPVRERRLDGVLVRYDRLPVGTGCEVRVRVRLRLDPPAGSSAALVARIYDANGIEHPLVASPPVQSDSWQQIELVVPLPDNARWLMTGLRMQGRGRLLADEFSATLVDSNGAETALDVEQAGIEGISEQVSFQHWRLLSGPYRLGTELSQGCREGHSLHVEYTGRLFTSCPAAGESIDEDLGSGLRVRMPISLPADDHGTCGKADPVRVAVLSEALASTSPERRTAEDAAVRVGAAIVAWSALNHFYPYWDVVQADWDKALRASLGQALRDRSELEFVSTLRRLLAVLQDGHALVMCPATGAPAHPPFKVEWIEDQLVIVESADRESFRVGDRIVELDGVPADSVFQDWLELASGTQQRREVRACEWCLAGEAGSVVRIRLERNGAMLEARTSRGNWTFEPRHQPIEEIAPGILFVDLSAVPMDTLTARIEDLAAARGVIFDLRGYPKGNHDILRHLTDQKLRTTRCDIPRVIRPDGKIADWDTSQSLLDPLDPRLRGRIIFLINGRAISYAESLLGVVEAYRLADLVGSPTAGANGTVIRMALPGGFTIQWTGMRVLKHDGTQHHLIGIQPTIPIRPTVRGIREGRDEVLEKGLEVV